MDTGFSAFCPRKDYTYCLLPSLLRSHNDNQCRSLLPHLREKVRPTQSDASRHLLCPQCGTRTKLNVLADGRRKCTVCGKKFRIHKVTEINKLQQCAEILLCFCLDFSAARTAQISHHRYRLVTSYYDRFRTLIAEENIPEEKIPLLSLHNVKKVIPPDDSHCKWCKSKIRLGEAEGPPVFGVQFRESGEVYIDQLKDTEAVLHFHTFGSREEAPGRREGYAGFICCGKFHRFTNDEKVKNVAEQLWTWIRERIGNHHGIWKKTDWCLSQRT